MNKIDKIKKHLQEYAPVYVVGVSMAVITVATIYLNKTVGEVDQGEYLMISMDTLKHMRETNDALLLQTFDHGDFYMKTAPF